MRPAIAPQPDLPVAVLDRSPAHEAPRARAPGAQQVQDAGEEGGHGPDVRDLARWSCDGSVTTIAGSVTTIARPPAVEALELAAVAVWCFAVACVGGLAGLVLGNLRLPAVLLVASAPAAGAGANIGISAVAAATASVAHIRAGRINWRLFGWMAPPSVAGAIAGGYLSGLVPGDALLVVIGLTLLYFGIDLLRRPPQDAAAAAAESLDIRAAVISGALIGLLGGLVGLILGALRMPALLRYVGEEPGRAVGTNLTVGLCVGVAGVVGHLPEGVDWEVLAVGAAASVPGALIGARFTGRLSTGAAAAGDRRRCWWWPPWARWPRRCSERERAGALAGPLASGGRESRDARSA